MSDLQPQKKAKKPAAQTGASAAAVKAAKSAPKGKAKKQLRKRRRRQMRIALALAALIVVLLALCGWQFAEYRGFQKKSVAVGEGTFFPGVYVEGIDVSSMTLSEAIAYWEENIEPAHASRTATLSDGTAVVASDVGYDSNYLQVLQTAYDACRTGGLEDQYATLGNIGAGVDYAVSRTYSTRAALEDVALRVALSTDHLPVDAKPVGFDAGHAALHLR